MNMSMPPLRERGLTAGSGCHSKRPQCVWDRAKALRSAFVVRSCWMAASTTASVTTAKRAWAESERSEDRMPPQKT